MVLHQEMVLASSQRRQGTADRIAWCARVDAWKAVMDSKAGLSNAPPVTSYFSLGFKIPFEFHSNL
jgi:hypothetical protein